MAYKKGCSKTNVDKKDPLLIFIPGGPGAAATPALYSELGVFKVLEDLTISLQVISFK